MKTKGKGVGIPKKQRRLHRGWSKPIDCPDEIIHYTPKPVRGRVALNEQPYFFNEWDQQRY